MRSVETGGTPRALVAGYHRLSADYWVNYAWYSADDGVELARYQTNAIQALSETRDALAKTDPRLAETESDGIARLPCNWRRKGCFPFRFSDADLTISKTAQAAAIKPHAKRLAREILRALSAIMADPAAAEAVEAECTFPTMKGKSSPFYAPGTNRKAAYALTALSLGARSVGEVQERCMKAGAAHPLMITLYVRIQAAKKNSPVVLVGPDGRPAVTSAEALHPKVRKVQAVPFVLNVVYARLGAWLLAAVRRLGIGLLPSIAEAQSLCREHGMTEPQAEDRNYSAEDVSNFDDSVAFQTYETISSEIVLPVIDYLTRAGVLRRWEAQLLADVERWLVSAPLIGPPLDLHYGSTVWNRKGGVVSGERLTSVKGTIINWCRVQAIAEEVGTKPRLSLIFGDDTLLIFDSDAARSRYEEGTTAAAEPLGFRTTGGDDAIFLQRRMPAGYGQLARMCMTTLQKEATHEPRRVEVAALGITARREGLCGHPFASKYDDLVGGGQFGPRLQAAYELARAHNFSASSLGALAASVLAARAPGESASQASTADELEDALLAFSGQDEGATIAGRLGLLPSYEHIDRLRQTAATAYGTGPNINYGAVKRTLTGG